MKYIKQFENRNTMDDEKLTTRENIELIVQAGLNAIPAVGGSLATLYFGAKQEKRFKRIEAFYKSISDDFEKFKDEVKKIEEQNPDELVALIEEINESIEADFTSSKLEYFKNCFYNSLTDPQPENFRKRKYFISTLGSINEMDIEILCNLYKAASGDGYIPKPEEDQDQDNFSEFAGSLEKLKSMGLLDSRLAGTLNSKVNWSTITRYLISDFGREFVSFCLENSVDKIS